MAAGRSSPRRGWTEQHPKKGDVVHKTVINARRAISLNSLKSRYTPRPKPPYFKDVWRCGYGHARRVAKRSALLEGQYPQRKKARGIGR